MTYIAQPPPLEQSQPIEKKKTPKQRPKNADEHVQAARELRDRYLEEFNAAGIVEHGKYDPSRQLEDAPRSESVAKLMDAISGKPSLRLIDNEPGQ